MRLITAKEYMKLDRSPGSPLHNKPFEPYWKLVKGCLSKRDHLKEVVVDAMLNGIPLNDPAKLRRAGEWEVRGWLTSEAVREYCRVNGFRRVFPQAKDTWHVTGQIESPSVRSLNPCTHGERRGASKDCTATTVAE
ncbi:MAG: hypothetical protein E8D52_14805 [Nitrospira sp.]|nr:MAG: hypothetical protein E8D52_14805 [Nitrospira sp.]